mmetsp:Transcript_148759/g.477770  ORF Transcript_148759/g.477770 Transcript_148759/m.477770 type:complete len:233 (-) Transcript_148759:21-719(-)
MCGWQLAKRSGDSEERLRRMLRHWQLVWQTRVLRSGRPRSEPWSASATAPWTRSSWASRLATSGPGRRPANPWAGSASRSSATPPRPPSPSAWTTSAGRFARRRAKPWARWASGGRSRMPAGSPCSWGTRTETSAGPHWRRCSSWAVPSAIARATSPRTSTTPAGRCERPPARRSAGWEAPPRPTPARWRSWRGTTWMSRRQPVTRCTDLASKLDLCPLPRAVLVTQHWDDP